MADCFISYRRTPSAPVATTLQAKLQSNYGIDAYVDVTRTDSTQVRFPERLMQAIADAPVFVCLLGERDGQHTLQSEWVLKEIQQAYDLQKRCIPVFQESYRPLPDMPLAVDYLLGFDGVHYFDVRNVMVDDSVRQIATLIRPPRKKRFNSLPLVAGIGLLVLLGFGILFAMNNRTPPESTPTNAAVLGTATSNRSDISNASTTSATATLTPTITNIFAIVTDAHQLVQVLTAAPTLTAARAFIDSATDTIVQATRVEFGVWGKPLLMSDEAVLTATPELSINTPSPEQLARTPVFHNADWTPYQRDFDGVTMVLVPVGCFDMGSDNDAADERPVHQQCVDEPFWIDKYEITNEEYGSTGDSTDCTHYSSETNQPRNCISWLEAFNFCEIREMRLPTELEWEYAARGPDNWVYPWGDAFIADNVAYSADSSEPAAAVGNFPNDVTWVGSLDMSGNVVEWTSSLFMNYPYAADHESYSNINDTRVIRGGWIWGDPSTLRSSIRRAQNPNRGYKGVGFRCARDFELSED